MSAFIISSERHVDVRIKFCYKSKQRKTIPFNTPMDELILLLNDLAFRFLIVYKFFT